MEAKAHAKEVRLTLGCWDAAAAAEAREGDEAKGRRGEGRGGARDAEVEDADDDDVAAATL